MSEWQLLSPNGAPQPGAPVSGGGGTPLAGYRDILDARRSAATPRTPNAEYPDGYLGNINSRRSDRLLQAVQSRLTQRNYQRGVHKGERIDQSDYFWPKDFNPQTGLEYEARGLKWSANGSTPVEQINHMGKNHLIPPEQMSQVAANYGVRDVQPVDSHRADQLRSLLPAWR
jgi:hypothetical protein